MSLIAWLDVSAEEQRRVRELVAMFSDKSTLDELGIGQVRMPSATRCSLASRRSRHGPA